MFGRRPDGRRLQGADPIVMFTPYIMPTRVDSQVLIRLKMDFDKMTQYIREQRAKGVKLTYMGLILAAFVRTVSQYPEMNRFIMNKQLFARNHLCVSFVTLKSEPSGELKESLVKVSFHPSETVYEVNEHLEYAIAANRAPAQTNITDTLARGLMAIPGLAQVVVALARLLDRYGLLPPIIAKASPFHTSMFITNLASIGLPAVNHHIYNFGTCSQFVSIGSVERTAQAGPQGVAQRKRILPLGLVCDERIAEGAMYAKMLALWNKLLNDPAQLEQPPAKVFYDEGHEYHLPAPQKRMGKVNAGTSVQA